MTSGIQLIKSGFSFIDKKWGGIYRGGGYLIVGPRKSGRTLLSLKFAIESIKQSERCLFFTTMRPKDLMIQAATLDFDLQKYMNSNSIIVIRVSPPSEVHDAYDPDHYMKEYINDIISVSDQYKPDRIIFDELTPYIGFKNLDILEDIFTNMLETIENKNITSFFIIGEPATEKSNEIVSMLSDNVTGTIYLEKSSFKTEGRFYSGTAILSPNVGHTEGQFDTQYWIEPKKGIVVESTQNSEVDLVKQEEIQSDQFSSISGLFNIYNSDDFSLILNNQIALYQTTGNKFNFLSFRLNEMGLLDSKFAVHQLRNLISISVKKRDKLCIIDDKIVMLLIRTSDEGLNKILDRMKEKISSLKNENMKSLLESIYVANIAINKSISDSDMLLNSIKNDDPSIVYLSLKDYKL